MRAPKRRGIASCCHSLSLRHTITAAHCGISNIAFRHRIFTSFPSGIMIIHLATSQPKGLGFGIKCISPLRRGIDEGKGGLILAKENESRRKIGKLVHVRARARTSISKNGIGVSSRGVAIRKTSDIALCISSNAGFVGCRSVDNGRDGGTSKCLSLTLKHPCDRILRRRVTLCGRRFSHMELSLKADRQTGLRAIGHVRLFGRNGSISLTILLFRCKHCLLVSSSRPKNRPTGLRNV